MCRDDRIYIAMVESLLREGKTEKQITKIIKQARKEDDKD